MTWSYSQSTGALRDTKNFLVATGYSGFGAGRNNPSMEAWHDVGPIPRGPYHIRQKYDDQHLGHIVMHLDPVGHDALGRTAFRIHGDNADSNASHGCIILSRSTRELLAASTDKMLLVTV